MREADEQREWRLMNSRFLQPRCHRLQLRVLGSIEAFEKIDLRLRCSNLGGLCSMRGNGEAPSHGARSKHREL